MYGTTTSQEPKLILDSRKLFDLFNLRTTLTLTSHSLISVFRPTDLRWRPLPSSIRVHLLIFFPFWSIDRHHLNLNPLLLLLHILLLQLLCLLCHQYCILLSLDLLIVFQCVLRVFFVCNQLEIDLFQHYLESNLPNGDDVRQDKHDVEQNNELGLVFQSYRRGLYNCNSSYHLDLGLRYQAQWDTELSSWTICSKKYWTQRVLRKM